MNQPIYILPLRQVGLSDIGIAGGDKEGLIFKKGKIIRKVSEEKLLEELLNEIENS